MSTQTTAVVTAPSTPKTPAGQATSVGAKLETPSPGNWRHPRLAEIARRRKLATFDKSNISKIVYNAVALLLSFALSDILRTFLPVALKLLAPLAQTIDPYQWVPMLLLRLLFAYNIYSALAPLYREQDDLSDIPLTPSQRALLGLNPNSGKPVTPDTKYITPPKYQRSTPRSSSPATGRSASGPGSGSQHGRAYSPNASPLWSKAVHGSGRLGSGWESPLGGNGGTRRDSLKDGGALLPGTPTSPRDSLRDGGVYAPGTPSPSGRATGPSVPLNSRWLYERGRSSSGSRKGFGL